MSSAPPAPPASSSPDVLEVSGLELRYSAHGPLVLRGVDLSVGAGERVAVMGPSGSGKSTLLLCAAGLLRAGAGRVLLDGVDVASASERTLTAMRRDRVAFVFQDLNLVESLTAAQNVALPGLLGGRARSPGDVAGVYTVSQKARDVLGWEARLTETEAVRDAIAWLPVRREKLGY